ALDETLRDTVRQRADELGDGRSPHGDVLLHDLGPAAPEILEAFPAHDRQRRLGALLADEALSGAEQVPVVPATEPTVARQHHHIDAALRAARQERMGFRLD